MVQMVPVEVMGWMVKLVQMVLLEEQQREMTVLKSMQVVLVVLEHVVYKM